MNLSDLPGVNLTHAYAGSCNDEYYGILFSVPTKTLLLRTNLVNLIRCLYSYKPFLLQGSISLYNPDVTGKRIYTATTCSTVTVVVFHYRVMLALQYPSWEHVLAHMIILVIEAYNQNKRYLMKLF